MVTNKEQFGFEGLDVQGITIHNTGNEFSAQENYDMCSKSKGNKATHYFIDENKTIEFMPLDWCVYHTGMAIDWACKHTIAIEICNSLNEEEKYLQAEKRAVRLIKKLMKDYNLTTSDIYFHKDFNTKTYCPDRLLEIYGNKKEFIRRYF